MADSRGLLYPSLMFIAVLQQSSGACRQLGLFGLGTCQYTCHCLYWNQCHHQHGTCDPTADGCKPGFAGTACQYVDLAVSVLTDNPEVSDAENSSRCPIKNSEHRKLPQFVRLPKPTWVDVILVYLYRDDPISGNSTARELEIQVRYNDGDNMSKVIEPHLARSDDRLITYHLPHPTWVTGVQILAVNSSATAELCNVNVLGGRNVAAQKLASQGQTTEEAHHGDEMAVVDGINYCLSNSSSRGDIKGVQWWRLSVGNNITVWRCQIYWRAGSMLPSDFRVNMTLSDQSVVEVFNKGTSALPEVLDFDLTQPMAISEVMIQSNVQLCEVLLFGGLLSHSRQFYINDTCGDATPSSLETEGCMLSQEPLNCSDGYYGWKCENKCRCQDPTEICDKLWGYCNKSHCKIGYKGDDCQQQCSSGTYGLICAKDCSARCTDSSCHHVTGQCTNGCNPGWTGSFCDQNCLPGSYGLSCAKRCQSSCAQGLCDHVTGQCTRGCSLGWTGPDCNQTCQDGFYGSNCSLRCSSQCLNNSCDVISGECIAGCDVGETGDGCDVKSAEGKNIKEENKSVPTAVIIGVVVVLPIIVALIAAAVVFWRCRSRSFEVVAVGNMELSPMASDSNKPDQVYSRVDGFR